MKKKVTIEDLARMVKGEFDEVGRGFGGVNNRIDEFQKWAARRFEGIDYKLKSIDHKLDKVVYRPEFEKLESRVRELEDLLAVIKKG